MGGSSGCGAESGGQCSCKANVQSSLCDSCENMFFNLTESNPDGCQGTVHACVVVCVDLLSILTSAGMHVYTQYRHCFSVCGYIQFWTKSVVYFNSDLL